MSVVILGIIWQLIQQFEEPEAADDDDDDEMDDDSPNGA